MLPGRHSLQNAATTPDGADRSALSEPLSVVVVSGATSSVAPRAPGRSRVGGVTTVDRVRLRIETVVDGLVVDAVADDRCLNPAALWDPSTSTSAPWDGIGLDIAATQLEVHIALVGRHLRLELV